MFNRTITLPALLPLTVGLVSSCSVYAPSSESVTEEDTLRVHFVNEAPAGTVSFEGSAYCVAGTDQNHEMTCEATVDGQIIIVTTLHTYDAHNPSTLDCSYPEVRATCEAADLTEGTYEVHYAGDVQTLEVAGDGARRCMPASLCGPDTGNQ